MGAVDNPGADLVASERLLTDITLSGDIPAQQRDPCITDGVSARRRLTLAPGAAKWEQVRHTVMEKTHADRSTLKKQGEELQKSSGFFRVEIGKGL
jgi:hypothetical protein